MLADDTLPSVSKVTGEPLKSSARNSCTMEVQQKLLMLDSIKSIAEIDKDNGSNQSAVMNLVPGVHSQ